MTGKENQERERLSIVSSLIDSWIQHPEMDPWHSPKRNWFQLDPPWTAAMAINSKEQHVHQEKKSFLWFENNNPKNPEIRQWPSLPRVSAWYASSSWPQQRHWKKGFGCRRQLANGRWSSKLHLIAWNFIIVYKSIAFYLLQTLRIHRRQGSRQATVSWSSKSQGRLVQRTPHQLLRACLWKVSKVFC